MSFVREIRGRVISERIACLTAGMVPAPLDTADLAPRVCGNCKGLGQRGPVCAICGGSGTTRRFVPGDPTHLVLAQGPLGLGFQQLIAIALADGRIAFVHLRQDGRTEASLYVPGQQMRGRRLPGPQATMGPKTV